MRLSEAIGRIGATRLRLTDAVVIAAAALLLMKGVDHVLREPEPAAAAETAASGPSVVPGEAELPAFARMLAFARTGVARPEVITTGSNPEDGTAEGEGESDGQASGAADPPGIPGLQSDLLPNLASPRSQSGQALLDRMAEQRAELDRRLRDLDMREELLDAAERRIEERMVGRQPGASPDDGEEAARPEGDPEALGRLVSMYEAMRPKDAARVFDRLALEVLVPLVEEMNPRRMAEVMAMMSPEAAERLTIALALRARGARLQGQAPTRTQSLPPTELPAIALPPRD
jgi:flagellar motility protein MotE (MotC chaperone)